MMSDVDQRPRILITRLSAIGDCILTLPVVCALRQHFPQAHIVWAIEPAGAKLLNGHRAVNEWMIVPKGWLKSPRMIREYRRQLRAQQFDWALDPQSLTKSSMLAWLSGAKNRVGFSRPDGREIAPRLNTILVDRDMPHIVDASLGLLRPLGIDRPSVRFDVPFSRGAETTIDAFVRNTHLNGGYAVINVGASCPAKQWPTGRIGRVARHLGERHNLPSVLTWCGQEERALAEHALTKAGGHAFMAPDTTLAELAALLQRGRIAVASDTGPLHLAVAVGTPCVGLHSITRAEKSGAYGAQNSAVEAGSPRIRNRRRRQKDDTAIRKIMVDSVCHACDEVLLRLSMTVPLQRAA